MKEFHFGLDALSCAPRQGSLGQLGCPGSKTRGISTCGLPQGPCHGAGSLEVWVKPGQLLPGLGQFMTGWCPGVGDLEQTVCVHHLGVLFSHLTESFTPSLRLVLGREAARRRERLVSPVVRSAHHQPQCCGEQCPPHGAAADRDGRMSPRPRGTFFLWSEPVIRPRAASRLSP